MFMTDVNDVKIYNLSAGKSLPDVSFTQHHNDTSIVNCTNCHCICHVFSPSHSG